MIQRAAWYSAQHCLLVLIEKLKAIDTGSKFGAALTDQSKAFDCRDHSLLVAKLHWYGHRLYLLSLYSAISAILPTVPNKRTDIEYGIREGSILGPLLFNINVIDTFYECEDSNIENYTDDTTPYA